MTFDRKVLKSTKKPSELYFGKRETHVVSKNSEFELPPAVIVYYLSELNWHFLIAIAQNSQRAIIT